jgi:hypothetical protein
MRRPIAARAPASASSWPASHPSWLGEAANEPADDALARSHDHATRITGPTWRRCYLEGMTDRRTMWMGSALALALTGCGPTHDEVATTVLSGLPLALMLGMVAVFALRRAWGDELSVPPWAIATSVVGLVCAGVLSQSRHFDVELLGPALMITSAATMGLSLLFGRMRIAAPAERSVVLTPLIVVGLFALPFALILLRWVSGADVESVMVAGIFALIGSAYLAPLVVLGLVIERVVRARRVQQRGYRADDAPG